MEEQKKMTGTIELSMSETVIMAMALRQMLRHEMSQKDRETAMLLECKLRLSYKGRKYRLMICGDEE
jgi:hypothetical protein